jgi:hypothetical protein
MNYEINVRVETTNKRWCCIKIIFHLIIIYWFKLLFLLRLYQKY